MECIDQLNNWYALFVITGEEDNVKERFKFRFQDRIRAVVPKRKLRERKGSIWSDCTRIMFPGYVLLNGELGIEEYYKLKDIPGIVRLLRGGFDPLKIDCHEIEILSKLASNDDIIDFSDVLIENGRVVVVNGPLLSMEGYIISINTRKGRAKVMLNFLGEERIIELGVSILKTA